MTQDWQLGHPDPVFDPPTRALREGSLSRLRDGFTTLVAGLWGDPRDSFEVGPFVDCARRLGVDPVMFLTALTAALPPDTRAWIDGQIRGAAASKYHLGWTLEETIGGPRYRRWRSDGALPPSDIR
jgi:hypothetical protein